MNKGRLVCCVLLALSMTISNNLLTSNSESKIKEQEVITNSENDIRLKILKQVNTYAKELEKQRLAEEKAKLEEEQRIEETKRASRGGCPGQSTYEEIIVEVSFYCSCSQCCDNSEGIMANGESVFVGAVASPQELPLGTILEIEGLGQLTVCDRGGYIQTYYNENGQLVYRLDVYRSTHQECLNLGRYTTTASIIKRGE